MANSDNVARIAGEMFQEFWYQSNIWAQDGYVYDYTYLLSQGGKSVRIPKSDLSDYDDVVRFGSPGNNNLLTEDSTIAALKRGEPDIIDTEYVDLVIDKSYDLDIVINPLAERRLRPSLRQEVAMQRARKARERWNTDVRAAFDAIPDARKVGDDIAVTTGNWGNAAHLNAINKALRDATLKADTGYWPGGEGDETTANMPRIAVMGPAMYHLIRQYLIEQKLYLSTPITDMAAARARVMQWEGWTLRMDNSIKVAHGAADDANHNIYFLIQGTDGVGCLKELEDVRTIESELYKGERTMGTWTWGVKVINDSKLMIQKTAISA